MKIATDPPRLLNILKIRPYSAANTVQKTGLVHSYFSCKGNGKKKKQSGQIRQEHELQYVTNFYSIRP